MKTRAVKMILTAILGIQSVSAFQGTTSSGHSTSLKSTDELYTPNYAPPPR